MNDKHNSPDESSHTKREYIAFGVDGDEYCIDIMIVKEIRGWTQATTLPHSPDFVYGLINLRGTVLPVIDLAARLGLKRTEPSSRHAIILISLEGRVVGLMVEAVSDILLVSDNEMHPTPNVMNGDAQSFVKSVLARDGRMIRLLDAERILPAKESEAA